jgi:hypothetical protein
MMRDVLWVKEGASIVFNYGSWWMLVEKVLGNGGELGNQGTIK